MSCKNHVCNINTQALVNISDYSKNKCTEALDYSLYTSIPCLRCGKDVKIFSKDMCKSCYNSTKIKEGAWNIKPQYIPTGKPRGRKRKESTLEIDEKTQQILELRNKGKTFREIGEIVGLSRQRVQVIYSKCNESK